MRGIQTIVGGAVATAAALLVLAGCASGSPTGSSSESSSPPDTSSSFPAAPTGDPITEADAVGTWGEADDPSQPSLTLTADGMLSGTDGCNRLTGRWELDDEGIEFDDLASTRMACTEVDTWLSGAESATISGDTMTVYADDRVEIGTLERTGDAPE
ncbi:META domain-containing protein [Agromyces sp. CFH 90414]|uniref:META domain-containing protein n=1 Tax=Agromyces agglutinans TaxID=2662258 RepID=A0A6I2F596_9MICO|nr:META domain-containing protein [Agromyces agglutinans]MRG59769.1 META domain-containing protein [Agromyces agglutinans]